MPPVARHRRRRDVSAQARDSRHARFHRAPTQKEKTNDQTAPARTMGALQDERNGSRRNDRAAHRFLHRGRGRHRAIGASADAIRAALHAAGRRRAADHSCHTPPCRLCWRTASCWPPRASTACAASSFIIPDALRAIIPQPQDCTPERVKAAMEFLCDEWLVDVATDQTGKALLIAAALTLIERSLLTDRPCFFITAGRRGSGKTTAIIMLIMARHRGHASGVGMVVQRGGAAKGADEPFPPRHALYPVGQHPARPADLLPAHRKVLHLGVLFRPPARRQRDSPRQRRDHPPLHRQQYRGEGRPGLTQPQHPAFRQIAPTPRTGHSRIRTQSIGPRTTAATSWRRSTPSCSEIPSSRRRTTRTARPASRCGGGWSGPRSSTLPG